MITYDNVIDIFNMALDNGISIVLDGKDLNIKIKKGQNIDRTLLELIKENKSEIIDFLQSDQGDFDSINQSIPKIYPFDKTTIDRIPLSFTQEGLWFIDRLTGSTHYHISLVQGLSEQLNVSALSNALRALVDRHEILRTLLQEDEQGAYQNIISAENWEMEYVSDFDNAEGVNLQEDLAAFTAVPFDLSQDYVFRARVYQIAGKGYVLNMVMHHIAFDGWSVSLLMNDLLELYHAELNNRLPDLPELSVQYSDYTLWQKEYMSEGVLEGKMNYWKNKLEGVNRLELPLDYNRPDILSYKGDRVNVNFGSNLSKGLNQLCQQEEVTLFMLLQTAIKVLFNRYSGQADICMGGSMANRSQKELEHLIGFFVNTVVLRSDLSGSPAFNDLLAQVKETTLEAYQHQDTPFDKVVDLVQEERALNRHPVVQVMLVLQNASSNSVHGTEDERLNSLLVPTGEFGLAQSDESYQISKFDITFTILESNNGISLQIEYATDLFNRNTIEQLGMHLQELLRSIVAEPTQTINQLNLLSKNELSKLAQGSKWLNVKYPEQQTVVGMFGEQVIQNPDNIAVTCEGETLTYAELDVRSNQLAHYLRVQGVKEESLVGICVDRGLEMIVGILAIIKAGGAYIPIDPDYPIERINYILEDSNCAWIVSKSEHNHLFGSEAKKVILLDTENDEIANCPTQQLLFDLSPDNALYVIYTSGSTGKPKGVVIEHRNVVRLFKTDEARFDFNASDVWSLFHSFCFDFSVWEMYGALLFGGKLVIASKDTAKDPMAFCDLLEKEKVTVLNQTPSAFYSLQEYLIPDYSLNQLRYLIFGGEALSPDRLGDWNEHFPQCRMINMYGITETTVHVTYKEITKKEIAEGISNIGQPIPTLECYVLDEYQNKLPIGQMGEIYVGGAGLARTYLNRPELTAERFIPHPFSKKPGARLYKTGDLACWLESGELEYLGRRDDQVKIRAHRIELGEIESVLETCDLVRQSVVLAKDDPMGNKRLIAYIIPQNNFDRAGIQAFLYDQLPKYMIPAMLMQVDHFPLTVNGKLHKALLPEPSFAELLSDGYVKPNTKLEETLVAIWEELLGIDQVGIRDDFFELGGHSLLATRVVARIRHTLNIKLGAQDLFLCPTVEELAERIGEAEQELAVLPGITATAKDHDKIPLSYAQERLWFIDKLRGTTNYHIPIIQSFNEKINIEALENALNKIVQRHDVLRTVILEDGGNSYQELLPAEQWELSLEKIDPTQDVEDSIRQDMQAPFDLSKDYMMRAKVYQLDSAKSVLLIVVHHIASDGWSMNIMVNELLDFYHAEAEGRSMDLNPLEIQYADYALWQRNNLSGEALEQKLNYWEDKLKGLDHLALPLDFKRPSVQSVRGRSQKAFIPASLSSAIKKMAQEEGVTPFMFLIAGFKLLLNRYSNQTDICVGSSIANREQKELEGLIGFFVNLITLRSNLEGNPSFKTLLKQVKQTTLDAYAHQDTPFEKVVDRIIEERDQSRSPLFQVSFVLQNAPDEIEIKASTEALLADTVPEKKKEQDTTTLFDLAMNVFETGDSYSLELVYCADLFKADTIERMVKNYQNILDLIVENPDSGIDEYPLLSDSEKEMLEQFNQTEQSYPETQSVVGVFQVQANKTPNNIALVDEQGTMTYAELEAKSNQLAHHLTKTGVKAGSLVGICMDRNNEMIIALLGILKSGAAYVPIDASYPQERIQFMVDHSSLEFILCSGTNLLSLMEVQGPQLILVEAESEIFNEEPTITSSVKIESQDKAYLMYTSGSTGMPKGVLIKHQSILRLLFNDSFDYLNKQTVIYHYAPLAFDASTFEIWGALLKGGQLILPSTGQKSLEQIEADLNNYKVNTLWLTAGLFHLAAELRPTLFAPVKYLLSGGDSIHISMVSKVLEQNEGLTFINGYGPTECTTFAVMRRVEDQETLASGANIIGTPIGNTKAYILSPDGLDMVPLGCPGELCLSGPGLAIGYLEDVDLNNEKFIPNPYGSEAFDRLYRTGDLARWQADGTIEFLGRKDNQVKIRGFRIEPGEIERVLDTCEMVTQNVVVVSEDGNGQKILVAYIIPEGTFDRKAIQNYLKTQLPDYMVPSVMAAVESFPLTENGKVDRRALPEVDLTELVETNFVEPQTPLQSQLAQIWKTLLKVEQIGIFDNFFDLGGHSLLAIRLLAAIREELELEIKITDIFENATIDTLSAFLETEAETTQLPSVVKTDRPEWIPLSYAQERLWFIDQLTGSSHYHISFVRPFSADLDRSAMENAFYTVVDRHEILRTVIVEKEGLPYQKVLSSDSWNFDFEQVENADKAIDQKVQEDVQRPFDLSCESPLRVKLYEVKNKGYVLVMVFHHIATDGWSSDILINELLECYQANVSQSESNLTPLDIQYADYAIWQRNYLEGKVLDDKLTYWENKLAGMSNLSLPLDYSRPAIQSTRGSHIGFEVDQDLSQKLNDLCKEQGVTLFMLLLTAFKTLLYKYTGQTDICVGSPTANRNQQELEQLIGFFVNTIALRSDLSDQPSFLDLLQQVKTTTLDAYQHQDTPFEKIVERVVGERDMSRSPLFQVMFMLQNMPNDLALNGEDERLADQNLSTESFGLSAGASNQAVAKFDLTMSAVEANNCIQLNLEYCIDLFDSTTINRMAEQFKTLLQAIVLQPDQSIGQLSLMSQTEQKQLLLDFNPAETAYPSDKTLVDLFKEKVEENRDGIALVFGSKEMTFGDLDECSDQLSGHLWKTGIRETDMVGICMDRGLEMIISILAILKTGAVYVPVDPDYPVSRQSFIANDSGIKAFLTNDENSIDFAQGETQIIVVDEALLQTIQLEKTAEATCQSNDLAYVIYTSGSTGTPKGCMVEHRNVVNEITAQIQEFGITKEDRILLASNITFDASVEQMFLALLGGASLYVIDKASLLDAEQLSDYVADHKITHVHMVPSLLDTLLERAYPNLRRVISGGDICPMPLAQKWSSVCDFYNEYGPTETTITSIEIKYEGQDVNGSLPIGKPIANTQVYILDADQNLAPVGVYGELCIGGAGLVRGYLNRPELTAERFIEMPFNPGNKVYRTGDVGRWTADGQIEFRGRNDSQVKVRGYRIELGEIETVLNACESVQQGVIVAKETAAAGKMIVAYIVPKGTFDKAAIQDFVKAQLPEYMVPALLVEMESIPLNSNGKVDRKALVEFETAAFLVDQYVAPSTELETELVAIWSGLLKREKIGVSDNFFELGGHSLLGMRVLSEIRAKLSSAITIKDLFLNPTIREIANLIEKTDGNTVLPSIQMVENKPERIPLSFAQERLWFIDQLDGSTQYHMPFVYHFGNDMKPEALSFAYNAVINRHDILRTVFYNEGGIAYQKLLPQDSWEMDFESVDQATEATALSKKINTYVQQPFDLSSDHIIRAKVFDLGEDGFLLVAVLHHIASDAWSQTVLTNELLEIYHSKIENRESTLEALPIQYSDYSLWQRNFLTGDILEQKLNYWENKLKGFTHLNLPLDFSRPNIQSTRGKIVNVQINPELTGKLQALCQEQGVTLYMLLLASFNLILSRYSGQTDICIGSSTANREQKEVENLIGFFANLMAVRNDVSGNPRFVDLLSRVKNNMLEAYAHQDAPFEKVVDRVIKERDRSMSPIFQVSLVVQNAPGEIQVSDQKENKLVPKSVNASNKEEIVTSLFDLTMNVVESNQCLNLELVYCVDLFKAETIELMGQHINELLNGIANDPACKIDEYNLLTEEEQQTLESFNNTETEYPSNTSVVNVFREQVQKTPEHTALICEDITLNYTELDQQSDVIAIQLVNAGVKSGDLVGICIDRSPEMIPGVLGVLKAGAAYVPIDPEYPRERIQYIIDDAQLQFILCSAKNIVTLMEVEGPQLVLADTEDQSELENATEILPQTIDALDPAYLIYTSGSTGNPKGVLIKHQSILRLLFNDSFEFLNENTILYQYAPLSFDASTFEVWGPLLNGGQIFMPAPGTKSLQQIEDDFRNQEVNTVWLTAGLFHLAAETRPELFAPIKFLLAGGESIHLSMAEKVLKLHPELTFINGYGPTESTTFAVMRRIEKAGDITSSANIIGKPIGNTKAYILNNQGLDIAPIGCPGELCLAGPGLAIEYLHNPELTAVKFVPNPYNEGDYDRLYRTGDLARWLGDGTIEFLGRKDNQVKIRGYRIELGEIERSLDQCDLVAQNVVLAIADSIGTQKLVAYIIPNGDFNQKAIQGFLKSKLPDYMLPNVIVPVESFPLTENGKVDRGALPAVDLTALVQTNFVPAQTPLQKQLAQIWKTLLKVEQIGIYDNFFDLGGHSLLAIRLLAAIREELGLEVKITNIFENATIDTLSAFIQTEAVESGQSAIVKADRPEWIPASYSQERLWFIDQLTGSTHYHIPFIQPFDSNLDRSAMENAFYSIIDRHEILRTVIVEKQGLPFQKVLSSDIWNFDFEQVGNADETFDQKIQEDVQRPFDLSCESPLRVKLYEVKDKGYVLVMVLHHIATDGWSNDILLNELLECYQANLNQRTPNLLPLEIQYADYSLWQRNYLEGVVLDDQLTYWENKLTGVSNIALPLDYSRPAIQSTRGGNIGFEVDKDLSQKLNGLCKEQGVTLFMLLLSAFKTLLYKYTGQTDICVGSPTANRNQQELEQLIGLFVNTIALRSDLSDQPSFLDLLQQVKTTTLDAYQHQDTPFEKIVDRLVGERDMSRSPLFQVMFMLQNMPNELVLNDDENGVTDQRMSKESFGMTSEADSPAVAKFDLTMSAIEVNDRIQLNLEYCIDLFDSTTINRMAEQFKTLLQAIVLQPDQSIGQLSLMSQTEQKQLLLDFNPTETVYPSDKTLVDLFKEKVEENRDGIALVFGSKEMTFGDLDECSNQLSGHLWKTGIRETDMVGICMDRGLEMIISILAILKTGAVYVPVDPDYPVSRQSFIAKDSGIKAFLTNDENSIDFAQGETQIIVVDEALLQSIQLEETAEATCQSNDLAYVIYTSGSTGTPKGCMVEHRNVVNEITAQIQEFGITKEDRILLASNITFDASVEQMFLALLGGASLYVIDKASLLDAEQLSDYVADHKITHVHMVPSLLDTLLERAYPNLRRVISGGDICPIPLAQKWSSVCDFYNEYGPTETTITSIEIKYEGQDVNGSLPIGKPIANTQVYILDADQNLAPVGVYGELCIGGAGLVRGYLNRPELTAERFVEMPFNPGNKVYRTGDVGRWTADGQIEFRGRNDSQVKIRGYRIELGEIETVLNACESVQQGVIVAKETAATGKMIVAYIVPKGTFDKTAIQDFVKAQLPEYMVPALLVEMESIPLNSNGKVDRKALAEFETAAFLVDQYVAPSTELETELVAIWSGLLKREKIGVSDNFFELGGHSLLGMRVLSEIRAKLSSAITIKDLFLNPTIREIAALIEKIDENTVLPSIQKVENKPERIPLSFAQERLWFIDQLDGSTQYHMPFVRHFDNDMDTEALSYAYNAIINRHDILRTVFYNEGGIAYQKLLPQDNWEMDFENVDPVTKAVALPEKIEDYIQQPFDLSNDHIIRAKIFDLGAEGYLLVVVIHHIASDAWSQNILTNELLELYHSKIENREPKLEALPIQYSDYSLWQRNFLKGEVLEQKLNYWENKLEGFTHLSLPLDFSRPNIQSTKGGVRQFHIDQELTEKLHALCQEKGITLYMLLMASFNLILSRYSGQTDICVGTAIANREQKEIENLIGFFTNLMAIRSDLSDNPKFTDLLTQVRNTMLEAYAHQDAPFEKVVDRIIKKRDRSMTPIFQVSLVLQNAPNDMRLENQDEVDLNPEPVNFDGKEQFTTSVFDLLMNIFETGQGLNVDLVYCRDLFKLETIQLMSQHFVELLNNIVENPACRINDFKLLTAKEEQKLALFNNTETSFPDDESLIDVFQKQVQKYPDQIAIVHDGTTLTYSELDAKSDEFATRLLKKGIQSGDLVGICIDRSADTIFGLLGILKVGAAYVSIDPEYPDERIQYMVDDAQLQFILSDTGNRVRLKDIQGPELIGFEDDFKSIGSNDSLPFQVGAQDPACLIYTSGSTGKPKGVLLNQQSILRLLYNREFDFLNNETILYHYAPLSFDASTLEIWGALLKGGQLVVSTAGRKSLQEIENDIRTRKINTLFLTTGLFHLAMDTRPEMFGSIQYLMSGGESIHLSKIEKAIKMHTGLTFLNCYGPTECATIATVRRISEPGEITSIANIIGKPLGNTKTYILAPQGFDQMPIGCPGELCLSGPGLALEYLGNPELTNEKFVNNPYGSADYNRLYRTGDLARWLGDGTIEFLGRIDNQVKVRGYRIEPGEIERTLDACELVAQNVILVKEDHTGIKSLIAYIIPAGNFDEKAIKQYLKSKLPDYMHPALMIPIDSIPLTENGKVNRKALPEIDLTLLSQTKFVAPQTPLQEQLAQSWKSLLKIKQVGIHDGFFNLGGHSLLAIRLLAAIREELGLEVKIADIFEHSTIDELSTFIETKATKSQLPAVLKTVRPERLPLSYSQERLWFIDQLTGSTHYHISFVQPFDLSFDRMAMEKAFYSVIDRHEILRTVILEDKGKPYQKVLSSENWTFDFEKVAIADEAFDQQVQQDIKRPFDLCNDHPIRAKLYEVKDKGFVLVLALHHIATDGWSNDILFNELLECYQANLEQRLPNLTPLEIQYADYALWQRTHLDGEVLDGKLAYWENKLKGVANLHLPHDYPRPAIQSTRGNQIGFKLDKDLSDQLSDLCKDQGVTLFMLLLSAFKVLLYRYSGQADICVGSPTANRNQQELEKLIGFFVSTIALRSDLSDQPSFLNLLQQVKKTTLDAYQHQDAPFEKIVDRLVGERDMSMGPLFQVMFILQNMPNELELNNEDKEMADQRLSNHSVGLSSGTGTQSIAKYDLTLSATEANDGIQLNLGYCIDLFDLSTIERMAEHFKTLLQSIVSQPDETISQLALMSSAERQQLLIDFNPAETAYPVDKTLIDLFGENVTKNPKDVAVVFAGKEMTFEDLEKHSDVLAGHLWQAEIRESDVVGICMEKSFETIISVIAILKIGAAYVPVDPAYPLSRKAFIIEDSGLKLLLTDAENSDETLFPNVPVLPINQELTKVMEFESIPNRAVKATDLAYIMYTSGSTGTPKGCMIEHRNVTNEVTAQTKFFGIQKDDRIMLASNMTFDSSVEQMFLALLNGARLYIIDKDSLLDADLLSGFISDNKITHIHMVPAFLDTLAFKPYPDLRRVISGGDVCPLPLAQKWSTVCDFFNKYGPTETTITSIELKYEGQNINGNLPIGKPLANTRIHILDENQNMVPIGVFGEICIGGAGLSRGYLNRPELTAERFIQSPFNANQRIYRTGDIGRWTTDGQIEFKGRKDYQIKIRGIRIELGEIETALNNCPGVKQGLVVARNNEGNDKQLIAYVVAEGTFDKKEVISCLKDNLPAFMVPAQFVQLDSFELNHNGKIDRKVLPEPGRFESNDEFIAPQNDVEKQLAEIWEALLFRDKIGVQDNFFEIGGHSLLATRMIAALNETFDLKIPLKAVFEFSTIKELGQYIELVQGTNAETNTEDVFEL